MGPRRTGAVFLGEHLSSATDVSLLDCDVLRQDIEHALYDVHGLGRAGPECEEGGADAGRVRTLHGGRCGRTPRVSSYHVKMQYDDQEGLPNETHLRTHVYLSVHISAQISQTVGIGKLGAYQIYGSTVVRIIEKLKKIRDNRRRVWRSRS